jgi:hypothetical protein
MYVWIWRHLPGGLWSKLLLSLLLVLAVCALLLFVVFPRVEPLLPFSDVTVDGDGTGASGS